MSLSDSHSNPPPFRPILTGCVARDRNMARMLEGAHIHALHSFATMTYRALLAERCDRRLCEAFDAIVRDGCEQFRLLGDLIFALGGNPAIHAELRVERIEPNDGQGRSAAELTDHLVSQTIREKKRSIDRLQTLMGRGQDRIVRSILAQMISDEERHVQMLRSHGTQ